MGPDDENPGLINDLLAPPTIPDPETRPPQVPGIVQREPTPKMDAYRAGTPEPGLVSKIATAFSRANSEPVMATAESLAKLRGMEDPTSVGEHASGALQSFFESLGPLGTEYTGPEKISNEVARHGPELGNWISRLGDHLGIGSHEAIIGAPTIMRRAPMGASTASAAPEASDAARSRILADEGDTTYHLRGYGPGQGVTYSRNISVPNQTGRGRSSDSLAVHIGGQRTDDGTLNSNISFSTNGGMGAAHREGRKDRDFLKILAGVQNTAIDYINTEKPHSLSWSSADSGKDVDRLGQFYEKIAPRIARATNGQVDRSGSYFKIVWPQHPKPGGNSIVQLLQEMAPDLINNPAMNRLRLHMPLDEYFGAKQRGDDLMPLFLGSNKEGARDRELVSRLSQLIEGPRPTTMMRQTVLPFAPEHQMWWRHHQDRNPYRPGWESELGDPYSRSNPPQPMLPFSRTEWVAQEPPYQGDITGYQAFLNDHGLPSDASADELYRQSWEPDFPGFAGLDDRSAERLRDRLRDWALHFERINSRNSNHDNLTFAQSDTRERLMDDLRRWGELDESGNWRGTIAQRDVPLRLDSHARYSAPSADSVGAAFSGIERQPNPYRYLEAPGDRNRYDLDQGETIDEAIRRIIRRYMGDRQPPNRANLRAQPSYTDEWMQDRGYTTANGYTPERLAQMRRWWTVYDGQHTPRQVTADSADEAIEQFLQEEAEAADITRRGALSRFGAIPHRAEGGEVPDPYRMEKGDTPSSVANKFGISLPDLMGWNKLTNTQARHLPIGYGLVTHGPSPAENKPASGGVLGPSEMATPVELVANPAAPQPDAQPAAPKQPPGFWDKFDAWIDPVRVLSGHAGEVDYNPSIADYLSTALFGLGAGRGSAPAAADMPRSPEFISRLTPKEIAREQYLQNNHGNNPLPSWYKPPIGRTGPLSAKELAREVYLQKYHGNHPMPYWYKGPQAPVEGMSPVDPEKLGFATGGRVAVGHLHSDVPGRTDKLHIKVPSGSYVIPADIVSGLGQGNTMAGAKHLERCFGPAVQPMAGGGHPNDDHVEIMAAGGEYVIPPHAVAKAGGGDMKRGHARLDAFVKKGRRDLISTLKKLPGPAK